jgi:7-cyano-7-deazaguanine synthase
MDVDSPALEDSPSGGRTTVLTGTTAAGVRELSLRVLQPASNFRLYTGSEVSIRKAVCLLSGGLDSTTCLSIARKEGFACYALSFDYGQRHRIELEAAARIALELGVVEHKVATIDLRLFGHSALTDEIDVPKHRDVGSIEEGIPVTYVPARNTIFLSFALAYAEVLEASDIFIGVNAIDYSGYPDCRPEYIEAFERLANLATKTGVEGRSDLKIHMPLVKMTKADIIRKAVSLGVDLGLTHSCYDPDHEGVPCGRCDSCLLRRRGFAEAGLSDPLRYFNEPGSLSHENL